MKQKSLKEKQDYLTWFLTNFPLKSPTAAKILYYISRNSYLLERVSFSKSLRQQPNSLLVSAKGSKTFPFVCKIDGVHYSDPEQIIYLLHNNPPDALICRLALPESPACAFCSSQRRLKVVNSTKGQAPHLHRRSSLLTAIDRALDQKNPVEFYRLSGKLKYLASL